ncbi:MAG: hypothetical protein ABI999_15630 [Acidobacteriota bacterium]
MAEYADMRPTERAKLMFLAADTTSNVARSTIQDKDPDAIYKTMLADSLNSLAKGLSELATGIRATYILLDEVKRSTAFRR